jgi:tripartite-type tricarboxylate transporter receptor subunit TctC
LPERITTKLRESGLEPEGSTGASFGKTIASDLEQWRELVNTNKITLLTCLVLSDHFHLET